jgi:drug/metabolite transporter (DMT)-like permease
VATENALLMHVRTAPRRHGGLRWGTLSALLTVYVAWGGTYVAIRVMVETLPPLLSTGARFLIAGALLAAWLRARGRRLRATRRELLGAAAVGTVILGDIGLLAVAEREVPAGLAALLIATVPLWVVALRLGAGERTSRATLAGVPLGLAGVALLVLPGDRPEGAPLVWLLVLVGAAAIEAAGQFASQRTPLPRDLLWTTALQLLAAGGVLVVAGAATGETVGGTGAISAESALAFAYLVLPGSILAYSAFVWLLEHEPVSTVATYAYVNPVVALTLGWALLGEGLSAAMAAGSVLVVASVALVVRRENR